MCVILAMQKLQVIAQYSYIYIFPIVEKLMIIFIKLKIKISNHHIFKIHEQNLVYKIKTVFWLFVVTELHYDYVQCTSVILCFTQS